MSEPKANLAATLKRQRRERRLSLRDLADETGVSFNTLSRVERGQIPDLKNFRRIVDWLQMPLEAFLSEERSTPRVITQHLHADTRLTAAAAETIATMVEEMYANLAGTPGALRVHLRSAQMFTPTAGALMTEMLDEMHKKLAAGE